MPAKISTICYIHDSTERQTAEYTIKELTGITRLSDEDPKKIVYLKIKAFIPIDTRIKTKITDCEKEDVVYVKGKFMALNEYYVVRLIIFLFYFVSEIQLFTNLFIYHYYFI
jgi:hypothetical protein